MDGMFSERSRAAVGLGYQGGHRVLVCGGGIAGNTVGLQLLRAGIRTTIVERSPSPRPGGQAVDLIMVVMNQSGMDHLLSSKFKLGADASAAAGPVGRDAGADTDIKMRSEVLTYSRARGLFAGVDLNGAALTQDKDETRLLYGKFIPFGDILDGKVEPTASSRSFLSAVRR